MEIRTKCSAHGQRKWNNVGFEPHVVEKSPADYFRLSQANPSAKMAWVIIRYRSIVRGCV